MSHELTGTEGGTEIDYYADRNVTPGALLLLNHPIVHAVRVRNHMDAEGIRNRGSTE